MQDEITVPIYYTSELIASSFMIALQVLTLHTPDLLLKPDEHEAVMRNSAMKDVVARLNKPSFELTKEIYRSVQEVIAARVSQYLRTPDGFQMPAFKLNKYDNEFATVWEVASN
ncbi:hypothetical protein PCANC_08543 [Puccinia coronata f. sp. avenae]|uniref:Uncharacterized protein n=1 Tax=Puccinia coronata f. sp. avenae TaxID=200324 RepID=A0A2N5V205_9BASI|nr:hypothetical protein PCANC_08543 [Puccinia coronata f. sp. avenae]